jgi:hypothetical protein
LAASAAAVAEAQLQSFPENLFWDFDFYLSSIHRHASGTSDYAGYLKNATRITVGLMNLYGQQSVIRFRYVHDFMYGFDWARWVRRDPVVRGGVEPFGLDFLQQTESRGRDIISLVEADDELSLYRLLAERGDVPVEAWRLDARPDANRDFDKVRDEAAGLLRLSR